MKILYTTSEGGTFKIITDATKEDFEKIKHDGFVTIRNACGGKRHTVFYLELVKEVDNYDFVLKSKRYKSFRHAILRFVRRILGV